MPNIFIRIRGIVSIEEGTHRTVFLFHLLIIATNIDAVCVDRKRTVYVLVPLVMTICTYGVKDYKIFFLEFCLTCSCSFT